MGERSWLAAGFAFMLGCAAQDALAGLVTSAFDTDADGWTAVLNGMNEGAYSSTFGNPPGSFGATDRRDGSVWRFQAPAKYLGDQSSNYGTLLRYDLWLSVYNPQNNTVGDVAIGSDDLILKWLGATPTAGAWTTQMVMLDTTGGWLRSDNDQPATEAELRSVLSDLTVIRIRGEYHSGGGPDDAGYLDNVAFGVPTPEPASLAIWCGIGLASLLAPRRWGGKKELV